MDLLGYFASLLIGVSLGLIGAGGSILTLPVLVYLFRIAPGVATSYSLFVVGTTSLVGAATNYLKGYVHLRTALVFGIFSVASTLLTRLILLPLIPDHLASVDGFILTKDILIISVFAILMILAAVFMLKPATQLRREEKNVSMHVHLVAVYAIVIGIVTGFLGAGGGFLLIPALVFFFGMSIRQAVGTSLLIIAMNSLSGFAGDAIVQTVNWSFLLLITAFAIAGLIAGHLIGAAIPGEKLRKGFGWFVLVMGTYIISKELLFS